MQSRNPTAATSRPLTWAHDDRDLPVIPAHADGVVPAARQPARDESIRTHEILLADFDAVVAQQVVCGRDVKEELG